MLKLTPCLFVIMLSISVAYFQKARIVGGDFATENQFSYQISLQVEGDHTCGGAILNQKWILSAAHCVVHTEAEIPMPANLFNIQAGSNVLKRGGQNRSVKRVIVHEDFGDMVNDVALLELTEPLELSEAVQPIPLLSDKIPVGEKIVISGWGKVGDNEGISQVLKFNTLTSLNGEDCKQKAGVVEKEIICLDHKRGEGACQGDSGGPAVWNGKLVGVSSFIMDNCGGDFPDAYVNLPLFFDWINKKMK